MLKGTVKNLFADFPALPEQEDILPILDSARVRIERIISNGHPSPADSWYDQDLPEWVMLVRGSAMLKFEDGATVNLEAGDYLVIEAHVKHRVEAVSDDAVWLGVHYDGDP